MSDDLLPIGEVARRFGLNASALRYYEERKLLRPVARHGGRRWYGPAELRRIAFIQLAQGVGFRLDDIAVFFAGTAQRRRAIVRRHIDALTERIARAERAKSFLEDAVDCPSEDPFQQCLYLAAALDRMTTGGSVRQTVVRHEAL